jgi:hypothetical protein
MGSYLLAGFDAAKHDTGWVLTEKRSLAKNLATQGGQQASKLIDPRVTFPHP